MLTGVYLGNIGNATTDIQKCVASPTPDCSGTLLDLLQVSPDRGALKALSRLVLAKEWFFQRSSMSVPVSLAEALRHHAPADRAIAASVFSWAIIDTTFGAPIGVLIKGLVENLSRSTPADTRARAILNLTAVADSPNHPWQLEARQALEKVAHLATAPEPPVVTPPPDEPPVKVIIDPSAPRKLSTGAIVAGAVVTVAALAGLGIVLSKR